MKMYNVNGYGLRFPHRGSWQADLFLNSEGRAQNIDRVRVIWKKSLRSEGGVFYMTISCETEAERDNILAHRSPFCVAEAVAKDWNVIPHEFKHFTNLWMVTLSGKVEQRAHGYNIQVIRLHRVTLYDEADKTQTTSFS